MNAYEDSLAANQAARKMFYFLLIALIPYLIIAGIYLDNPRSPLLMALSDNTNTLPAIISSKNLLLSKAMDVYTKSAPLISIIFFLTTYKHMRIKEGKSAWELLGAYIPYAIFYIIMIYFFLFDNRDLTSSAKILYLASHNNFTLLIFYMVLYSCIYVYSCLNFWAFYGTYRAFKERR